MLSNALAIDGSFAAAEAAMDEVLAGGRTISAKTVEHHLSSIYAKLGVRSRTALAAVLLGQAPPQET